MKSSIDCCDDQDSGGESITYTFHYSHKNVSLTKTVINQSYAVFVDDTFEVGPSQKFAIKLFANNSEENEIFYGNLTTEIVVIGKGDAMDKSSAFPPLYFIPLSNFLVCLLS